jgi:MFS family permease
MTDNKKLFGLPAESGRWIFILLGLVMNVCLGAVYAYSIFKGPVEKAFSVSAFKGGLPFMVFLAFFAVTMFFGGRIMEKLGPKKLCIIGGVIVGLGWILSSFATNISMLTLTYGVIAGSGVGLVYGCPIAVGARWFPDKKGLAVGLIVAGFGGSALITGKIADVLIPSVGLFPTFLYFGIAFSIILVILSLPLKFPVAGWKPAGWAPAAGAAVAVDLDASQMVKTPAYWGLFLCFIVGSLAGLMAIGISKPVGNEVILIAGSTAASLVGVFACFNALGRPLFGWLTDNITPRYAAMLNLAIILVTSIIMLVATQGTIEVSPSLVANTDGKMILSEGTVVAEDGKIDLTKGMFVIKPGNVEQAAEGLVLKDGSISDKDGKMIIKSSIVAAIEKDGASDQKQGAVVLNEGTLNIVRGNINLYIIAFIGFWMCLGGWLAIAPTTTATFFGLKNYARNYGVVFFAYGIGAIFGGLISGKAKDIFGSYTFAFYPTAVLAAVGLVIAFLLIKPPKKA